MKLLADTKKPHLYMAHVHGIGFRLIGETFATLPTVTEVTMSGYSQRPNKATGEIQDEYLYSVHVERDAWARIKLYNLKEVDLLEALAQFDLRRTMTKTGIFNWLLPTEVDNK